VYIGRKLYAQRSAACARRRTCAGADFSRGRHAGVRRAALLLSIRHCFGLQQQQTLVRANHSRACLKASVSDEEEEEENDNETRPRSRLFEMSLENNNSCCSNKNNNDTDDLQLLIKNNEKIFDWLCVVVNLNRDDVICNETFKLKESSTAIVRSNFH
jgi:hypothetical protein